MKIELTYAQTRALARHFHSLAFDGGIDSFNAILDTEKNEITIYGIWAADTFKLPSNDLTLAIGSNKEGFMDEAHYKIIKTPKPIW